MSNSPAHSIWLGYDPRETAAFAVAKHSIRRFDRHIPIYGLVLDHLQKSGLYYRPTRSDNKNIDGRKVRRLWDVISDAPMSTEFALTRFLVPTLAKTGWALFADCDIMVRRNINALFALSRPDKAVMVVKHDYHQAEGRKLDGQLQTIYPRKNWSSVMLLNCDHPSNKKLTRDLINRVPGRDLHAFCWLEEDEIGELSVEWNYLVGHSKLDGNPAIVHFTDGVPDMPGYEDQEYADEWRAMRPYAVGAL